MNLNEITHRIHQIAELIRKNQSELSFEEVNQYMEALAYAEEYLSKIKENQKEESHSRYTILANFMVDGEICSHIESSSENRELSILRGKWLASRIYADDLYLNDETEELTSKETDYMIYDIQILQNYPKEKNHIVWESIFDYPYDTYLKELADFQEYLQDPAKHIEDIER